MRTEANVLNMNGTNEKTHQPLQMARKEYVCLILRHLSSFGLPYPNRYFIMYLFMNFNRRAMQKIEYAIT